jgi:hypothetical protein
VAAGASLYLSEEQPSFIILISKNWAETKYGTRLIVGVPTPIPIEEEVRIRSADTLVLYFIKGAGTQS